MDDVHDLLPSLAADAPEREHPDFARWLAVLQRSFLPVQPPPAALQALLACAQPVVVPRGVQFLSRARRAEQHWLLVSGHVALGLATDGRIHQQTREVAAGHWVDSASALVGAEACYLEDGVAERDSVLLSFAHRDLLRCGTRHPTLLLAWAASLVGRVRDMLSAELSLMRQSTESRFAAWLLQNTEPAGDRVLLRQRKRAIASQLGATPETLSRVLKQLALRGVIEVNGYEIGLTDVGALRELAAQGR